MAENELETSTTSNNQKNEPHKVILIGRRGVGKSTLYLRIRDREFYEDVHNQTLDCFDKTIFLRNNKSVEVSVNFSLYTIYILYCILICIV